MTNKNKISVFLLGLALMLGMAVPAFAQTAAVSARVGLGLRYGSSTAPRRGDMGLTATTSPAMVQKMITRSDTEITARITALNNLTTRIGEMKNVSASDQASLDAQIQAAISDMTTLKAQIDADTDPTTLKTDLQSITKDYRVYALILPQTQIIAAADRANTIAADIAAVGTKLAARITDAQNAGKDVTALQASLTDLQAKTADAQTQAQAAITGVASLAPDQGDQTIAASNLAALKAARADIKTATTDDQAARQDAQSILKAVEAFHIAVSASATSTTSAQ